MPNSMTSRAGRYVNQPSGYKAFIPSPLPPDPPAETAMKILDLRARCDGKLRLAKQRGTATALRLLDQLFEHPVTTAASVGKWLDVSVPTANDLVATFEKAGSLHETTGQAWHRVFAFEPYLKLLRAGTEVERRITREAAQRTGRTGRTKK